MFLHALGRVSAIVGGMTLAIDIFSRINKQLEKRGGGQFLLRLITTSKDTSGRIADVIMDEAAKVYFMRSVEVNYSLRTDEMLAQSHLDVIDPEIANFRQGGDETSGFKKVTIIPFSGERDKGAPIIRDMDSYVRTTLARAGYRPAYIEEIVTLAMKDCQLQRKFPIVALGTNGNKTVILDMLGEKRRLHCHKEGDAFPPNSRFAGVRMEESDHEAEEVTDEDELRVAQMTHS